MLHLLLLQLLFLHYINFQFINSDTQTTPRLTETSGESPSSAITILSRSSSKETIESLEDDEPSSKEIGRKQLSRSKSPAEETQAMALKVLQQYHQVSAARQAREESKTPRDKRNQTFLNHLATFLEPIEDDCWHEFTTEVQSTAVRYARKKTRTEPAATTPSAALGAPTSTMDCFTQPGMFQSQQQQFAFNNPTPGSFPSLPSLQSQRATCTSPISFPTLQSMQQSFLPNSPVFPALNTPQLSPDTMQGSNVRVTTAQGGAGDADVMTYTTST